MITFVSLTRWFNLHVQCFWVWPWRQYAYPTLFTTWASANCCWAESPYSPSDSGDLVERVPPPPSPLADAGECPSSLSIEKWDIAKHLGAGTRLSASEKADLIWISRMYSNPAPASHFLGGFFGKQRRAFSLKWLEQFKGLVYSTVPLRMRPTVCHGGWRRTWGRLCLRRGLQHLHWCSATEKRHFAWTDIDILVDKFALRNPRKMALINVFSEG